MWQRQGSGRQGCKKKLTYRNPGVIKFIMTVRAAKLSVPPERAERRGPERCSGTFRTAAPAIGHLVI